MTSAREGESLETQRLQINNYAAFKGCERPDECVFVETAVSVGTEFQERIAVRLAEE